MKTTPNTRAMRKNPASAQVDYDQPAARIVRKLGGLQEVCRMSEQHRPEGKAWPSSTVWGWMKKGLIPIKHVPVFKAIGLAQSPKVRLKDAEFMPPQI